MSSTLFSLTPYGKTIIDKAAWVGHTLFRMKLEFRPERLALIRTARAHELGLPVDVVKAARRKLDFIEAAPDERTLRNWKSLNFKELKGFDDGRKQIRVNNQYRIVMLIEGEPPVATVIEIGDTH